MTAPRVERYIVSTCELIAVKKFKGIILEDADSVVVLATAYDQQAGKWKALSATEACAEIPAVMEYCQQLEQRNATLTGEVERLKESPIYEHPSAPAVARLVENRQQELENQVATLQAQLGAVQVENEALKKLAIPTAPFPVDFTGSASGQAGGGLSFNVVNRRSCNMHSDCDKADREAQAKGRQAEHCRDEGCSDCFGN